MKILFAFISILFFFACVKKQEPVSNPPVGTPATPVVHTWLALGDSYTIGQGVPQNERFPTQTATLLLQLGIQVQTPTYIATTGWTTGNLQYGISNSNPNKHTLVSLLIGVNDQYQRRDTTGYRQRFTELLVKAIELANGKKQNVFVLSIPDYSVTPFAASFDTAQIRKEIDWFNTINKNVTTAYTIAYLDITPSSREARFDRSLTAADGLHPSGLEYKRWADKLAPMVVKALK